MATLDGFFEGLNKGFEWYNVDEEFNEYAIGLLNSVDILFFGRVTYQLMTVYWASSSQAFMIGSILKNIVGLFL